MKESLKITTVLATGREGRQSENVAKFFHETISDYEGINAELVDVRDFARETTEKYGEDEKARAWQEKMEKSDGLIIVSPEYNHGYPGELKILLDRLYGEYNRKPVGICGVSSGILGGARMVEQLRLVFVELQMVPIRSALYFKDVSKMFDDSGNIVSPKEHEERIKKFMDEFLWYANILRRERRNMK